MVVCENNLTTSITSVTLTRVLICKFILLEPLGAMLFLVPLPSCDFPSNIHKIGYLRENKYRKQQKGRIAFYVFKGKTYQKNVGAIATWSIRSQQTEKALREE